MNQYVIIGGGVAGLAAAIRLGELGAQCLVIESGDYPAHKVCGEFFSSESIDHLKKWDIHPVEIHDVHFHLENKTLKVPFPTPAGSLSHIVFDPLLVKLAKQATIYRNTKVISIKKVHDIHLLELSTGEIIETPNLIVATGRIPSQNSKPPKMRYKGIKAHFENGAPYSSLEMFLFKGAYAGISPIENGKFNVACLASLNHYNAFNSPEEFINYLKKQNMKFETYLSVGKPLFSEWMTVSVPEFGLKKISVQDHTYYIGDAAGTIPPVTGNGLTLALKSGIMAAEYAINRDFKGFRKAWHQISARPIFWAKTLHKGVTQPMIARQVIKFPKLANTIYQLTRV